MATPPPAPAPPKYRETPDSSVSWFQKTVTLRDWWLIKSDREAQGKRLAVAGYSISENKSRRFFKSAPITKRFDVFTLETADRIVVILQGFINKAQTIENGFPSEIFDRFFFGFPCCWEEHTDEYLEEVIDPGADVNHSRDGSDLYDSTTDPVANEDDVCAPFISTESKGTDRDIMVATVINSLHNSTHDPSVQDGYVPNKGVEELAGVPVPLDINASRSLVCSSSGGIAGQDFLKDVDFPQLTTCHTNAVNVATEAVVFSAELSSNIVGESSHITEHHKTCSKRKHSSEQESNFKQSADAHGVALCGCLSDQHAVTVDATESGIKVDMACPSNVKGDKLVAGDPNSGTKNCAKDLKDGKIWKLRLRSPSAGKSNTMQKNAIYLNSISVVTRLPASADAKVTPSKVVTRSALRNMKHGKTQSSSSKVFINRKDEKSLSEPNKHLKHGKRKRDSSTSQCSLTEVNVGEAMLRAGRTLRRSSTHTKSQDRYGQAATEGSFARKKAKRKIEFDVDVTPKNHRREKKTCILSADALTFKRSRSGRLLLPTLHFWRNQIPVYDAKRNITGIREEVDA